MSLLSVQMQLLLGYTSSLAGHVYLAMMVAGLPLAGFMYEISKKLDVRFVIGMMCICSSVVLTWLGLFDKNASYDKLAIPVVFLGFCVAALSAPTSTLATYGLSGPAYKRAAESSCCFVSSAAPSASRFRASSTSAERRGINSTYPNISTAAATPRWTR